MHVSDLHVFLCLHGMSLSCVFLFPAMYVLEFFYQYSFDLFHDSFFMSLLWYSGEVMFQGLVDLTEPLNLNLGEINIFFCWHFCCFSLLQIIRRYLEQSDLRNQ